MMLGVLTTLTLSVAMAQDYGAQDESSKAIGVWNFSIVSDAQKLEQDHLQATLEERTREAVLPLIQQHTELKLITPENLQISGPLPVGNRVLETSRALGLDYVIVGKVYDTSSADCVLKLYHVATGSLLQQVSLSVANTTVLTRELPPLVDDLLVPILQANNQNARSIIASFEAVPREDTLLFVDGKVRCQSLPCSLKIKEGNHNIQFHNPYYEVWAKDLYLDPNADVTTKLKPNFGLLTVVSEPSGIQFEIDGVSMGKTPLEKHRIEQGKHEISVLDPCYTGRDHSFTINTKDSERIRIIGVPRQAGIEVYLENPTQEAKVFIDDSYVGKTPLSTNIPMCARQIKVENEYGIYEGSLSLRESEVEKLDIKLYKKTKASRVGKSTKSTKERSRLKDRRQSRSRRFNPNHALWSTYTVQYGLDTEEWRINLPTVQMKSGHNDSFIAPILPGWRAGLLNYSITGNSHQLFPIGFGYGFDFELGLIQPYYEWHWLSIHELTDISEGEDLLTETTVTPYMHKVGVDFMLDHSPFSGGSQQYGGTLQLQSSYTYCHNGEDEFCKEDLYIGASLFLLRGRWGF